MSSQLILEGKKYTPATLVGERFGYTKEYILLLIKQGKIDGKKIGHKWYAHIPSADHHFKTAARLREVRRKEISESRKAELHAHTKARKVAAPNAVPQTIRRKGVIALGTREDNLMRKVIFDVPFGELQLPRVASLAFGSIPAFAAILTPTPSIPDFFPVFPMAATNAILLDVDGDGRWAPPGPLPSFCARPCTPDTAAEVCIDDEECLPTGYCGIAIEGQCLTGPPGTEWSIITSE